MKVRKLQEQVAQSTSQIMNFLTTNHIIVLCKAIENKS